MSRGERQPRGAFAPLFALLALAAAASGQNNLPAPMYVVTGAPYSGEQVQERVETLRDGTRVTRAAGTVKMYRDADGRTRTERSSGIQIDDPVAAVRYLIDPPSKTARRIPIPPRQIVPGDQPDAVLPLPAGPGVTFTPQAGGGPVGAILTVTVGGAAAIPPPRLTTEDLGTLMMEGVLVEGTRQTLTIPAGMQGNDQPLVTVTDTWMSPELKIAIVSKVTDPRAGETATKMTRLSRAEPDPALFRVPADYQVVDGK